MNFIPFKTSFAVLLAFFLFACSSDDPAGSADPFVVAFEMPSGNLSEIEGSADIDLVYSRSAEESGTVTIAVSTENAIYGTDFTTEPAAIDGEITLSLEAGSNGTVLQFNELNPLDESTEIIFTITAVSLPGAQIQGNSTFILNSSAAVGGSLQPEVGGPNEPFQVYVDLSSGAATKVQRDSWDLGFYSGPEFRVGLNASIYMAAAQLPSTDIDEISQDDVEDLMPLVAVGTFDPANEAYIDYPDGDILRTAIDEVSTTLSENKVYLVNLGFEVGTETPEPGGVSETGDLRGWKKIRVLRDGDGYVLQYANLNETSHQEIAIAKSAGYNFTFFSFNTNAVVPVEPAAEQWDLNFTVFTNIIDGYGSYTYPDGVLHNRKGGVVAYSLNTADVTYENFTVASVNNGSFLQDQRVIGSSWRDVMNDDKVLVDDIFYVIKDANGNVYKLMFTGLLNENGERGYPEFKYDLLQ